MPPLIQPSYDNQLPIHQRREEIITAIRQHPVVIVAGETGSGKTTQLPKFLLECGLGKKGLIGCTQPRRVAALSVAERIAKELKVPLGREVGAKIRFTEKTSAATAIKVMTDGILLNEIQEDPTLRAYDAILIDEAHERSLNIDFILGSLIQIRSKRKDLKIVITSATIDTATFSKAFGDAPVIEVSGRMYPVDLRYRPIGSAGDTSQSPTPDNYIDAAVDAVEEILLENQTGDILIFLPAERDIHELKSHFETSSARSCEVLLLYGRLANAEQQRIFRTGGKRRIILSTNIAETSLTVPGIRYVVDTGYARISRYSTHSRTQRLPIEPISRSSADQRKGRCGRISDGICYRLYSEEDYHSRPPFNTPEIHRSNLASVILRMIAFRLGEVDTFPFIDPPPESAIRGGYRLLSELGAIKEAEMTDKGHKRLTVLGRRLARLPVDPTVGRMLLQALEEDCVPQVLIIAAGLSVQDPRERPTEKSAEADTAHRRFMHKDSDFLTLLNIWEAYHREPAKRSQNQLRKFCKVNFLSFQRMREWSDIHDQLKHLLEQLLREGKNSQKKQSDQWTLADYTVPDMPGYASIHSSILAGLLGNIAVKEEAHLYRGSRNRKAMLFPGSGLFDKKAAKELRKASYGKKQPSQPLKTTAPDWIVCGEWMETGRLYARTAAAVKVAWIESVAGDLIQTKYSEPFWSEKSAAALCKERKLLFGLEIQRRHTSLSPYDPNTATDIFVRNGLVEAGIKERPSFLQENLKLSGLAASELARRRMGSSLTIEDRLFDFYRSRIKAVGSFAELRTFAKSQHGGSLDFLKAEWSDLLPETSDDALHEDFPGSIRIGGSEIELTYLHEPGGEGDGVTLHLPVEQLDVINQSHLDWAVPGHLEEKVSHLLRALPKEIRIRLHPLKETSRTISRALAPSDKELTKILSEHLLSQYDINARPEDWKTAELPEHLEPRIEIKDRRGKVLATGRNPADLKKTLREAGRQSIADGGLQSLPVWKKTATRLERKNLNTWNFGDLPESIDLTGEAGLPLKAYPAIVSEKGAIHLQLMPDSESAQSETETGWLELAEAETARECAWLCRDLRDLKQLGVLLLPLGSFEIIKEASWRQLRRYLFRCPNKRPLKKEVFLETLKRAQIEQRGIVPKFIDTLRHLLEARQDVAALLDKKQTKHAITYPGMRAQLEMLVPADLLDRYDYEDLPKITRFLRGMIIRAERAKINLSSDMEKAARIKPYAHIMSELESLAENNRCNHLLKPYRILLEEFKISVFAQQLGTGQKVSEKRLDSLADELREVIRQG